MLLLLGTKYRNYDGFTLISYDGIHLGGDSGVFVQYLGLMVFVLAVALMAALVALVRWTRLGKAIRAVSFDREAASMMGIDTDRVIAGTFFLASALAGAAGVMFGLLFSQIYHLMGFLAGLKGFTAAVVGGIQHSRRDARGTARRAGRVVGERLHERKLVLARGVRDPDRSHAGPPHRAPRHPGVAEGVDPVTEPPDRTPEGAEPDQSRGIGVDQWVAESDDRRERHAGLRGRIEHLWGILPPAGKLALLTPAIIVPFLPISNGNLYNYGVFILIYALLALGLNVVVGWAGLLDLGCVAFFGFGAYIYAFLSGTHSAGGSHLHLPLGRREDDPHCRRGVRAARCLSGLVVAQAARRLPRDRDALLRSGLPRVYERRQPGRDHERLERPRQRRPADLLRRPNRHRHDTRLLLVPARHRRPSPRRPLRPQRVAYRPGVEGVARRPARRRADGDAGEPAEDHGVQLRRGIAGLAGSVFAAVQTGAFPRTSARPC